MGIGTAPVILWFSDFHIQNLLTILAAWGSHQWEANHSSTAQKFHSCNENWQFITV